MSFSIKNIHKKYNRNYVLQRVNISFEDGLHLLTGINGIGKSTLLKLIAKVINPTNSNYIIETTKVAYLCEKIELVNDKPLSFLKSICKINNVKYDIKSDLKMWNIPNKNIMNLSKGNKQKVAILMMKYTISDVYLFDEPTDSLDKRGIELFTDIIKKLLDENKVVIISTHEPSYFTKFEYNEVKLCLE